VKKFGIYGTKFSFIIADDAIQRLRELSVLLDHEVYRLQREHELFDGNVLVGFAVRNESFVHGAVHIPFGRFGTEIGQSNGAGLIERIAQVVESNTIFSLEDSHFEITLVQLPETTGAGYVSNLFCAPNLSTELTMFRRPDFFTSKKSEHQQKKITEGVFASGSILSVAVDKLEICLARCLVVGKYFTETVNLKHL